MDQPSDGEGSPPSQTEHVFSWWRSIERHRRVVGVGGLLVALSPFLPWLHQQSFLGVGGQTLDLFGVTAAIGRGGGLPWLMVAVGGAFAVVALARPVVPLRQIRDAAFGVGLLALLLGGWPAIQVLIESSSAGLSVIDLGSLCCAAGIGALVWGGVHGREKVAGPRKRRHPRQASSSVPGPQGYVLRLECGHTVATHADKAAISARRVRCPEHGPQKVVQAL